MVRKEWQNLNGTWEFAFDDRNEGRAGGWHSSSRSLPDRILVPFTYESALSGIGKGKEIHERVWYRRAFTVPAGWNGRRIRLNFNASDWETTVWVNGKEQGVHRGGYDPFSFDITNALKPNGPQEVVVAVYDPADPARAGHQPKGKQLGSEGIFYTRTTGIWQNVWMEPIHTGAPELLDWRAEVDLKADVGQLTTAMLVRDADVETKVDLIVSRGGKEVSRQSFVQKTPATAQPRTAYLAPIVRKPMLWSPESPALYDVTLRTTQRGAGGWTVVDEVKSYCAFRRYEVKNGRLQLNGKPYFLRGVLDQGYWPDGIMTPPTDAALKADVEATKRLGFNMARKHVKVEDPRWYYWCDRLGVAVWQDMPSSHNLRMPEARENFRKEWTAVVKTTAGYPSVLHWIPFNENWGDPGAFQDEIVTLTRKLDPTRPITDASGWTQRGLTDVIDAHDYSNNLRVHGINLTNNFGAKPKVVGEYGGIALPVAGHTWSSGWGYQSARNPEGLLRRVRYQTSQLFEAPNLSGFVYTQLTDVEQELNGLLTYDRLPKADLKSISAIFTGADRSTEEIAGGFIKDWLVLGPLPSGADIRSAINDPAGQTVMDRLLELPHLTDEAALNPKEGDAVRVGGTAHRWKRVRLDSDSADFHKLFGGQTNNAVVYCVARLSSARDYRNAALLFGSDDAARVWLNGKLVHHIAQVRGVNADQDIIPGLNLTRGENLMVVKVVQGIGGWGLTARFEDAKGSIIPATSGP